MTRTDAPTLELLLQHQSLVRSIARDLLVDPHAADDVVQQTWLAALRHAATGAQVGRSLLARIATNLAFNRRRDTRRRETRERRAAVAEPLPSVAELAEREDERRRVVEAVFALHEPLRETVLRRYLDDRSESDVAEMLGIPLGTVRSRLRLARTLLRERLERDGDAPRSARALVALAGWSADEAAAAIAGGKGVVLMAAKAWVGVAAALTLLSFVGVVTWRSMQSPHSVRADGVVATRTDGAPPVDPSAEANATTSTTSARSPVVGATATETQPAATRVATIRGRCVTPEHTPIAGAIVSSRKFAQTATSDATGRFELVLDAGGQGLPIDAVAPGRARSTRIVGVDRLESSELGDFVLPLGATIRGRVLDESDRPIAATIERRPGGPLDVYWQFGLPSTSADTAAGLLAQSDGSGRFEFPHLSEGWYSFVGLHAEYLGTEPVEVGVTAGETADVVVRMRAIRDDERIRGRVFGAQGQPCVGAKIGRSANARARVEPSTTAGAKVGPSTHFGGNYSQSVGEELTTDAFGAFTCVTVSGWANDFTFSRLADAPPSPVFIKPVGELRAKVTGVHGGDPEVILRLEPSPLATFHVIDADDGLPCANATVTLTAVDRSTARYASTDADGTVTIDIPKCAFMLSARSMTHQMRELGPLDGDRDPALEPIRLTRKPQLRGRVVGLAQDRFENSMVAVYLVDPRTRSMERAGFPLAYANAMASCQAISADGTFAIALDEVDPATPRAFVRLSVRGFAPTQFELPVPRLSDASPVTLSVSAGGSIEGRVTAPSSRSPAGLVVYAANDDIDFVTTHAEEDGSYRFEHLRPGMWRVAVAIDEPAQNWSNNLGRTYPPPDVEVVEGRDTRRDLTFMPGGIATASGTIRCGGSAQSGTTVSLSSDAPDAPKGFLGGSKSFSSSVGPSGTFVIDAQTPGSHTFRVAMRHGAIDLSLKRTVDLVPGANDLSVDLHCGVVKGHASKTGLDRVKLEGDLADGTHVIVSGARADDGAFTLPLVPAGTFMISNGRNTTPVEVRAGETTTIEWP